MRKRHEASLCVRFFNASKAVVDLRPHSFFVTYVSTSPYGDLKTWTDNGRDDLSGPRIISTPAQPEGTVFFTTPMVFDNEEEGFGTYGPDNLVLTMGSDYHEVVVRESYWGDANLDGMVSSSDYGIVDGWIGSGTSWATGDLNLSGHTNPADYALIDGNIGAGQDDYSASFSPVSDTVNVGEDYVLEIPADTTGGHAAPLSFDVLWGDGEMDNLPGDSGGAQRGLNVSRWADVILDCIALIDLKVGGPQLSGGEGCGYPHPLPSPELPCVTMTSAVLIPVPQPKLSCPTHHHEANTRRG